MKSTTSKANLFVSQLQLVEQLIGQNRLQEAAGLLNTLSKVAPNDPRLFLLASVMADAANNAQGSLAAAHKALEMAPGWSVAIIRLAEAHANLGQHTSAMQNAELAISEAAQEDNLSAEIFSKAAAIAIRSQHYVHAAKWAEQASTLAPESARLKHQLGEAQAYNGHYKEAITIYSELLLADSNNQGVLLDRLMANLNLNNKELAQADATQLLSLAPENKTYQYYDALIKGETPETQPAQVVSALFDSSAATFDQHLLGTLKYTLPKEIAAKIIDWYPDKKIDVLDLGCGTGLLGAYLGRVDGVIVGVDLSSEMIEKAHQHNVYAQFNQVNILDALQATRDNYYDVITALDVLIYVGDLEPVIPNAHRILTKGGRFVFSCELAPKEVTTFALQDTQRYVHQIDYVNKLLKVSGFKKIDIEEKSIRLEAGQPVIGFIVSALK